ncbi:hypothetical protein RRF57_004421 [Xylaria bambusicola]|uniref:Uncharacterized protein n=1 Tax=Xylaria bambusicola TaxID=326684 RepID=A0AAN7UNS9_9PEZI
MFKLFVTYPSKGRDELPELVPHLVALGLPLLEHLEEIPNLVVVVLSNFSLDSLGTSHGCLAPHHGGGPTESCGHHGP